MQLDAFLPFRLVRLSARVAEAVSQVHGKRFGLSRDEWRVLAALGAGEAQPTREVTAETGLDKVAISRAASALEDRGLIRRTEDRGDRRIKILKLTREGSKVLAELDRVMRAREDFLLEGLTEAERGTLDAILARLTERAEALVAPETAHRCRPDCSGACEKADRFLTPDELAAGGGRAPVRAPAMAAE